MSNRKTFTERLLRKFLAAGYVIQGEYKAEPYHSVKRPHWLKINEGDTKIFVRIYTSDIRDGGKQKYYLLGKQMNPKMKYAVVEKHYNVLGQTLPNEQQILSYGCHLQTAIAMRDGWSKRPSVAACWIEEVI